MKKYTVTMYNDGFYLFVKPDLSTTSIFSESTIWRADNEQEISKKITSKYGKKYIFQINELEE